MTKTCPSGTPFALPGAPERFAVSGARSWHRKAPEGAHVDPGVTFCLNNVLCPVHCHSWRKEDAHPRAATLDGFANVPPDNDTALAQAVSQHPVAVAVCCGALQ